MEEWRQKGGMEVGEEGEMHGQREGGRERCSKGEMGSYS